MGVNDFFYPTDMHAHSDLLWGDMQHGRLHLMTAMTGKGKAESLASDRMLLCEELERRLGRTEGIRRKE